MKKSSVNNDDLADKIEAVDKKVDRRFSSMNQKLDNFKTEVNEKLQPFHDYLVGINALKESSKGINLDPKVYDLIKWLILIIGAIIGVKLV